MTAMSPQGHRLGERLRALRVNWNVTQRQLSDALGLSAGLVSSWENGTAVPPEERLNGYARFFASRRSTQQRPPALVPSEDLTAEEERVRGELIDELVRLREEALDGSAPRTRETGALGGRFWYFSDGQPITILCTPLSQAQLGYSSAAGEQGNLPPAVQYATNPSHPNAVQNLGNGDIDALLELVGHIRAENPTADVRWLTYDRIASADQLTGHLVVLGNGDAERSPLPQGDTMTVSALQKQLNSPISARWPPGGDDEFDGEFCVSIDSAGAPTGDPEKAEEIEVYKPRFLRDETLDDRPRLYARGAPQLSADVAFIIRSRSPLNPDAKLTMLCGMFSRGTYGAVRAFTDATFRTRNEQWLTKAVDPEDFWILFQVAVIADKTISPDLSRAASRLRMSSQNFA
ncbi:MAG TPA: helix-turn-helix transcriptional regulator [Kineosporiaceae bacterium]|nr:helix-turn-helix transcriptional regulator [Kineosporiaceae bacterium]